MSSSVISRLALLLSSKRAGDTLGDSASSRASVPARDSDEALLAGIAKGEREALAELFCRYARLVRALSYKVLRDFSEADDLLQEVFLHIHHKSGMFDSWKGTARSWIVQISYRRAIDRRRQLTARHFYTHLALDNDMLDVLDLHGRVASYEQSLEGIFGKKGLKKMFDALSENQRKTEDADRFSHRASPDREFIESDRRSSPERKQAYCDFGVDVFGRKVCRGNFSLPRHIKV